MYYYHNDHMNRTEAVETVQMLNVFVHKNVLINCGNGSGSGMALVGMGQEQEKSGNWA